ncbi:hypothetical protein AMATHDRAFT_49162 [Amanita thiersii Skay4041]|uniref:Uncharacterized protein n=1 Tax=Amanita thiersii Skay4041 TaxID=703135 RepID=A0A2A9NKT8_9AGAR|nr:hypothetical protein AMATHDRAFT_49162 [Amanita thiersii Skay4041]
MFSRSTAISLIWFHQPRWQCPVLCHLHLFRVCLAEYNLYQIEKKDQSRAVKATDYFYNYQGLTLAGNETPNPRRMNNVMRGARPNPAIAAADIECVAVASTLAISALHAMLIAGIANSMEKVQEKRNSSPS